jgi:NADH-quinone oxidoreductase subunit M
VNFLLSSLIGIPLLGAALIVCLPRRSWLAIRITGLVATFLQLGLSVLAYVRYEPLSGPLAAESSYRFVEKHSWIQLALGPFGKLQINYFLGVDGLNISLVLLSGIVLFLGALASWNIKRRVKAYFGLYLLLSASVMGCFVALDFFLFYLFFEFMLLPMYFLIGLWGGPKREYAAIKFFLYTLLGSVLILIVMIGLYSSVLDPEATARGIGLLAKGQALTPDIAEQLKLLLVHHRIPAAHLVHSFSLVDMLSPGHYLPGSLLDPSQVHLVLGWPARLLAFLLLFAGFAIKLPAVPLHTWLPDAHVQAPTPISVVLAGVLLKIGAYGLLRIAVPVFPEAAMQASFLIGTIGVLSIIYGALCALAQVDLKKLIAYSSISHMGFVLLGLAAFTHEALNGVVFQLFSHGLIASMLFLISGVLYDRTKDRMIGSYRGLSMAMPRFTGFVIVAFFASLGLPGFSGFIAELLILLGAFSSHLVNGLLPAWLPIVAMLGLLLGAAYALWTIQRMFFGRYWTHPAHKLSQPLADLTAHEMSMLIPLTICLVGFGLFPSLLLDSASTTVQQWISHCLQYTEAMSTGQGFTIR